MTSLRVALRSFDPTYISASIFQERESLGLNTLDCEFGQPPQHSMPVIIECAILGSPHQKLTLSELRLTLKRRFRHYEQEEEKGVKSWEVSPFHTFLLYLISPEDKGASVRPPVDMGCLQCPAHFFATRVCRPSAFVRSSPYVLLTLD